MKKIRLNITKIKNHYYAKIPDVISSNINIQNKDCIEVTIHNDFDKENQIEMWRVHPEDINEINFKVREDVHTMNMYNRIYIPEKYRFFLPNQDQEFILLTNIGNIKTHLTTNGYFTKGLRQWFHLNGPVMPNDKINFKIIDEDNLQYEMELIKCIKKK